MEFTYRRLEKVVGQLLADAGVPARAAQVVTDHLLANEVLSRASHGLFRLPGILRAADGVTMPDSCELRRTGAGSYAVEAGGLPGIYAMSFGATEMQRLLAERGGVTAIAVRGYSGTTGNVGLHLQESARAGFPVLAVANSEHAIAAPGATNPIVGTNPIAYAFPADNGEVIIGDYASSVWSYGDISLARLRGQSLPDGVVLDAAGQPSNRTEDADLGSMLPSGGHRGFVQALLVELLCGALAGGKVGAQTSGGDAGLLLGIAPSAFGVEDAVARTGAMAEQIRTSRPIADTGPRVPGSGYARLLQPRPESLEIDEATLTQLAGAGISLD